MLERSYMEHLESQPEKTNQKVILEIQAELLRRAGCTPEDNEKCAEWITAYARDFRNIAESEPSLSELWQTDPKATLQKIASLLYANKGY